MQGLWQKQIPVAGVFRAKQRVKFVALLLETKPLVVGALVNSPDDWKKFSLDLESYIQKNS
jgi:hypothetical protein